MTNLLNLPQIPAGTAITISADADWDDQFFVAQPGFAATPLAVTGTLNATTSVTALSATAGIVPGMVAVGYGIPPGTTVSSVNSGASSMVLSNAAIISATVQITLYPPPLDLTGITFSSMLRPSAASTSLMLSASTTNGLMTNGTTGGQFGWSVPSASLPEWPNALIYGGAFSAVVDIQATDNTGAVVDLCAVNGAIPVTVTMPANRTTLQ